MSDDKQTDNYEYQIISKDGEKKTIVSPQPLFVNRDNSVIHLDEIIQRIYDREHSESLALALENAEAFNVALYNITEESHDAKNMQQFFQAIHNILDSFVYAKNVFIALYDEGEETFSIPYIVDSVSDIDSEELALLPTETLNKTLTGYMLRSGKMLHVNADEMQCLEDQGEINHLGGDASDWLGFPLKKGDHIFGALVIQSYDPEISYTSKDIDLLMFVSQHVASALSRKKSDEKLLESEKKLREVLENSRVISYKFNLRLNKYEYVSNNIKHIFGYTSKEYLNMSFEFAKKHIHPDDRANYREQFIEGITKAATDADYVMPVVEYRWRHNSDNRYHWFSDTRTILCDENRKPIAIIGSVRDITETKEAEDKLRRTEDALQKMQELENIGVLAGGIAHDFNNILTGIFGNITLAKMKLETDNPAYKYIEKTEKSMDRAKSLTQQLLTFAKGGEPVKEEVILTDLIKETALFDLTGSNVKPIFKFSANLVEALVDKGQIQQVISNLVINANQAMPDGGHLTISVGTIDYISESNDLINDGCYIQIIISDEGDGIEEELKQQIFDPYYSTKEEGSGLGLTTVYSIIHKHNGHIYFDSEVGKGTTFTILLPMIESNFQQTIEIIEVVENKSTYKRILIMDDDEDILALVSDILEIKGYDVSTALDGEQMLETYQQAQKANTPFNAVIMDLTIPGGMGGKEAALELLKVDAQAKSIVSSGYADDPIMANYNDYGFKAAISKPFTLNSLDEVLQQVLAMDAT